MRILQLTWSRMELYGGIQTCVRSLHQAFLKRGSWSLVYGLPWQDPKLPKPSGCSHSLPQRGFGKALDGLISESRADALISHNLLCCYTPGIAELVSYCARSWGLPHVVLVHDVMPVDPSVGDLAAYVRRMRTTIIDHARVVVTSAYNYRDFSRTFTPPDDIVPPGIDFDQLTMEGSFEPLTIAFPGRITRYKGALQAIEMLGELTRELGTLKVILSAKQTNGARENERYVCEITGTAARFPLLNVSFLSSTASVSSMYRTSALTLCLSEYEGFGMTPLESLACGCPVVARPVGGMEWLRGVRGALCVERIEDVPRAIRTVLEDLSKWRSEVAAGRNELKRTYDIHSIAERYLSMLA